MLLILHKIYDVADYTIGHVGFIFRNRDDMRILLLAINRVLSEEVVQNHTYGEIQVEDMAEYQTLVYYAARVVFLSNRFQQGQRHLGQREQGRRQSLQTIHEFANISAQRVAYVKPILRAASVQLQDKMNPQTVCTKAQQALEKAKLGLNSMWTYRRQAERTRTRPARSESSHQLRRHRNKAFAPPHAPEAAGRSTLHVEGRRLSGGSSPPPKRPRREEPPSSNPVPE